MAADEVKRRSREQTAAHRARSQTVRGARTATAAEAKAARMQEGYDVYQRATGRKVRTGIAAEDRKSRADYHTWAKSDAGKAAWKARKKPKPKPTPSPTPKPAGPGVTAQDAGDALAAEDKDKK